MPKITIGTPHRNDFRPEYVVSLAAMLQDARYDFILSLSKGSLLHVQRNHLVETAMQNGSDFLMLIDTDIAWTPDDITSLVELDKDIVSGLVFGRKHPFEFIGNPATETGSALLEDLPTEPFKALAVATPFLLIQRHVLEKFLSLKIYPFDFVRHGDDVPFGEFLTDYITEDISFSIKARELGFDIWCVPSAKVGHVGDQYFWEYPALLKWFKGPIGKMTGFSRDYQAEEGNT
jgi:cellulose synthase/poly-beta-1,6-N-acetylglucosamine synthase-like glycosyltransferase